MTTFDIVFLIIAWVGVFVIWVVLGKVKRLNDHTGSLLMETKRLLETRQLVVVRIDNQPVVIVSVLGNAQVLAPLPDDPPRELTVKEIGLLTVSIVHQGDENASDLQVPTAD